LNKEKTSLFSSQLRNFTRGWLFTIAANKCRDYWRKENKTKQFWKEAVYSYSAVMEPTPLLEERVLLKDYASQMAKKVKTYAIKRNPPKKGKFRSILLHACIDPKQ
jgi:DNA-directed RNA polymerase specialized sigma24 family protein